MINAYGITETANWIAGASSLEKIKNGIIGKMWGGYVGILNEKNDICSSGEGEILIKTPSIMLGYLKNENLTNDVFFSRLV